MDSVEENKKAVVEYFAVTEERLLNGALEREVNDYMSYLYENDVDVQMVHQSTYIAIIHPEIMTKTDLDS